MPEFMRALGKFSVIVGILLIAGLLALAALLIFAPGLLRQIIRWSLAAFCLIAAVGVAWFLLKSLFCHN